MDESNEVRVCTDAFWAGLIMAKTHTTTLIIDQETMVLPESFENKLNTYLPSRKIKVIILSKMFSAGSEMESNQGRLRVSKSNSIREVVELISKHIKT